MYKINLMVVLVAHPLSLFGLGFFFFSLLATCRGETMVEETEREREKWRERVSHQTFLGLEIGLECNK